MDIHQILKLLPHRYPILLVDRVEIEGKRIKALKNVSINEPFYGSLSKYPVMPGVLMLEARRKQPPYSLSRLGCDAR
jgi:3-hydroxyacyl-[acyl-carrier-protein] dehydratase